MSVQTSAFLLGVLTVLSAGTAAAEPVPLIFDTDMGNDIDDALALGLIHALQSHGECKLLAVTVTKDNPFAAPCCDVINTRGSWGGDAPEVYLCARETRGGGEREIRRATRETGPGATGLLRRCWPAKPTAPW